MEVEYREIEGHPGYRVGTDGSVWSCRESRPLAGRGCESVLTDRWHQLKPYLDRKKRLRMCVGTRHYAVGRLVLAAFVRPPNPGEQCCHFPDRDPSNCDLGNLRWDTNRGNAMDRWAQGTMRFGETHQTAKLTDAQVDEIRELSKSMSGRAIAKRFGMNHTHVNAIIRGAHRKRRSQPAGA